MKKLTTISVLIMAFVMMFCMTTVAFADDEEADGTIYPYGLYEPTSFEHVSGGMGNVTITCDRICIASRVYAYLDFSSTKMTEATVDGKKYAPVATGSSTVFRVPVKPNKDTLVTVHTTAMPAGADINYTVKVGVDKDKDKMTPVKRDTYKDGFYTTYVSTDRGAYGYKTDKTGKVTQIGIKYPSNDYEFPVTVQIKDGKIEKVAYTVDPVEYDMGNTTSDFNYLIWAMDGREVSQHSYDYLNEPGENYDNYHLDPHPAKNGKGMAEQIVDENDITGVDTVTSATLTSRAIVDSVDQSLMRAERGEKDDPEPVLPQPDTSKDIVIEKDGYYIVSGECFGADLGNDGDVIIQVKNGKMTAERLYIEQRKEPYPKIFPGTEPEAIAAGEAGWLLPLEDEYDYGGTTSSLKFAGGTIYTGVNIKSLDKKLPFVMFASGSGNWFNRRIKLYSDTVTEISEDDVKLIEKNEEVLFKSAIAKPIFDDLQYNMRKGTEKATAAMVEKVRTNAPAALDAVVSSAKAVGLSDDAVKNIEAKKDAIIAFINQTDDYILTDQPKRRDELNKALEEFSTAVVEEAANAPKAKIKAAPSEKAAEEIVSNKAKYESDSYAAFEKALKALNDVLAKKDATAEEIMKAKSDLEAAISKLVEKQASKIKVTGAKKKTFKVKKLKKKAASFKAVTVKKQAGKVTYSAKITGKSKKVLKFNKKTAKLTVKKGTKKGTYKAVITVKDPGSKTVMGAVKKVTVTVKVKK